MQKNVDLCKKEFLKLTYEDFLVFYGILYPVHRRRIKTEENAKVVAAVWGKEFIQFLAALAILPSMIAHSRVIITWST